jgi:hypothetical protein
MDDHFARIESWTGDERTLQAPGDRSNSLNTAVDDIVERLTRGGQTQSTGEDGVRALEVVIGFHVSDRLRGQWVALPIAGTDRQIDVRIG